ncbi:Diaminopimelate decarboxylase [Buchnera aphidicola (Phyllaphis fagi)]|uniref:diaminopimelate decarboxylase n=1 Tax=Buchnera aphidicola TaxID=9 RepID=UPI003463D85F
MFNLNNKNKILNTENILSIINQYNTPIWIYDGNIIQDKINILKKFDIIRFAQKACSNIHILRFIKQFNVKIDAVSLGEIERALIAGFTPKNDEIIFTSDIIDTQTLKKVIDLNITVNVGSLTMLEQIGKISPKHRIWMRINPKFGHGHSKKTNTGGENSKHGIWNPHLALPIIKKYQLNLVGLHMHIGSGVNYQHLKKVCNSMLNQTIILNQDIQSISAGGGLPIPYQENDIPIDINNYFNLWNHTKQKIEKHFRHPINLEIEPGRFLVGESGILVAKVYAKKKTKNKKFVLVESGFNDLMRPVMYGSYHHISIIPKDNRIINKEKIQKTIIGGPLCESGDIFTQNEKGELQERDLPKIKIGDYIVFHNTGAYGATMSSNYNTKPFIPEVLFENGKPRIIKKRQTIEELIKLETDIPFQY